MADQNNVGSAAEPSLRPRTFRGVFVGRKREGEELRAALKDALSCQGRLVMLAGEPGMGKTRLAEELGSFAAVAGAHVLWGRCWEGGGAPAFWPWIQIIREALQNYDFARFGELRPRIDHIAGVLTELRPSIPGFEPPQTPPSSLHVASAASEWSEPARFRLFDSVAELLKHIASSRPVVAVLDDLHAADQDSLLLLRFLARNLAQSRILLITTHRELEVRPPMATIIADIGREGRCVLLTGLAESEVGEFIASDGGIASEPSLVSSLHRASAGNPFFLDGIVRLMIAEGDARFTRGAQFSIPDSVRTAIRRRLSPLSENARCVLEMASVMAPEIDLAILPQVCGLQSPEVLGALEEGKAHGLIVETAEERSRYGFVHALVPEVLRAEIGVRKLLTVHQQIAEALEDLYSDDLEPRLALLAYHYHQALPANTALKAVEFSRRGAARACAKLAYDEAARLYRTALEALARLPKASQLERCELLLGLGEAESKAGSLESAFQAFQSGYEIAQRLQNADLMARAALGASGMASTLGSVHGASIGMLENALAVLGERDDRLRALLMARLAAALYWSDRSDRAGSLSQRAVEIARRSGDTGALVAALWTEHRALWGPDNLENRLAGASEIITLAERAGDTDCEFIARQLRIAALLELPDIPQANEEIKRFARVEQESGRHSGQVEIFATTRALMRGEFQEAERQIGEALSVAQRRRDTSAMMMIGGQLNFLRFEQGRCAEAVGTLKSAIEQFPALVIARCALSFNYCELGDESEARAEFESLAARDFADIPRDWNWLAAMASLASTCNALRDSRRAAILLDLMRPYSGRNVTLGWGEACYGSAAHHLGLVATAMGRLDDAQDYFETALRVNLGIGARPAVAHTRVHYSAVLLMRGAAGDRERALSLLMQAQEAAQAMGMKRVSEEARELVSRARGGASQPLASQPSPESRAPTSAGVFCREGEVWTLAYEGKVCRLRDIKGLTYIAHLLHHPGIEFHSMDLVAGVDVGGSSGTEPERGGAARPAAHEEWLAEAGLRRGAPIDAGEMLDAEAKAAYRMRLSELREELEDARETGNTDRAGGIQDEIDALAKELSRAVGLSGRDRRAASISERARLSVTRAIRTAIDRITENHSELGHLLGRTIRTGTFCSYVPDRSAPIKFDF